MKRVLITGLGAVSPHGVGAGKIYSSVVAGRSAIGEAPDYIRDYLPDAIAGVVPDCVEEVVKKFKFGNHDRATQFALIAADEAVADADLLLDEERVLHAGVAVGTGMGGAATLDATFKRLYKDGNSRLHPASIARSMANGPAAWLSMRYGLRASGLTYCAACSSSAAALGESYRLIKHGYVDVMLVVGTEAILAPGPFLAWHALHILAPRHADGVSTSCRPFAVDRAGLVLSEGAAAVVLESADSADDRGKQPYAEFVGYATTTDAHHITQPASGGQISAMRQSLDDAGMSPDEIGYINAHGTATRTGDAVEANSIKHMFANCGNPPSVSSTKSMHGHLLGASGALEFMLTVFALHHRQIPPTLHLDEVDPDCAGLDFVPHQSRTMDRLTAAMSNSFAFGGSNVSLVVRDWPL